MHDPSPIVEEPGLLLSETPDEIVISVPTADSVLVRTWYTPYWSAHGTGEACVTRTSDNLVEIVVTTPGIIHLRPEFSLEPLVVDRPVDDCDTTGGNTNRD